MSNLISYSSGRDHRSSNLSYHAAEDEGPFSPPLLEARAESFEDDGSQSGLIGVLLRFLGRNWFIISALTVLLGGRAYYVASQKPAMYEGDFQLIVEPLTEEAKQAEPASVAEGSGGREQFDYSSHLAVLKGPGLLAQILDVARPSYSQLSIKDLERNLDVQRLRDTRIITAEYRGTDPEQVQFILEQAAKVYLQYSLDIRRNNIGEGIDFVDEQISDLQNRNEVLQNELSELQQQNTTIDPSVNAGQLAQQIGNIVSDLQSTRIELQQKLALQSQLQNQLNLSLDEAIAVSIINEDPLYQELQGEIQRVDKELAKESARFEAQTPIVQALAEERNSLTTLLQERQREALGSLASRVDPARIATYQSSISNQLNTQFVNISNEIQSLQLRAQELENLRVSLSTEIQSLPSVIRQYDDLYREIELVNSTLNRLLSRRESFRVQQAQTQIPWELISPPSIPRNSEGNPIALPIDWKKDTARGFMIGLGLGVVLSALIERWRNTFLSSSHIQDITNLPVLADVPELQVLPSSPVKFLAPFRQEKSDQNGSTSSNISLIKRRGEMVEIFNALYGNLTLSHGLGESIRSLAICTTVEGGGTAAVAYHLAKTAEAMDQWTLIVDTDLRNPSLAPFINQPNLSGLGNLLEEEGELRMYNYIIRLSKNLFVLPSGTTGSNPAHLLGSQRMKKLMNILNIKFELVIYNTHSLGSRFADTKLLLPNVDGVLLTLPVGVASLSVTQAVTKELKNIGIPILGTIATTR